ncbi:MAG: TlpA family protein disulfide reductase, partial [Bacteroidota bacterium]
MGAKQFFQKNKGNLMIVVIILLLFIPQTGMPIKVFFSRLVSFSPSEIAVEDRVLLDTYDWQLASTQGALANLSASEGNVVLINFWATWCP